MRDRKSSDAWRPRLRHWHAGLALAAGAALSPGDAFAEPQGTGALTVGIAGTGEDRAIWDKTVFHLGGRGDVLFGRSANTDFGVGPYAEIMSHAFDDFQFGGGASLLLPVIDTFPIVLSAGGYGRVEDAVEPGLATAFFWGSRSYNYHSAYVMSGGLLAQFRYGLGDSRETSIVIGAQLDLVVLSLPFLFLANAIAGGSPDTDPVKR
jgi:hypothetical protein